MSSDNKNSLDIYKSCLSNLKWVESNKLNLSDLFADTENFSWVKPTDNEPESLFTETDNLLRSLERKSFIDIIAQKSTLPLTHVVGDKIYKTTFSPEKTKSSVEIGVVRKQIPVKHTHITIKL